MPGVAYDGKPGVQVSTGRLSESDGMDGAAIEGRFSGGRLGAYGSSRRMTVASAVGGEVMAARARRAREGVGVGEAAEKEGSSKALRSGKDNLIA
jgi:hypothetical protein